MSESRGAPPLGASLRARLLLFGVAIAAIASAFLWLPVRDLSERALEGLAGLGAWGPVLVGVLYVPATLAGFPCSWITLGSGFLFGGGPTALAVVAGSNIGANAAFLLGRGIARRPVEAWVAARPRFAAIDRAVAREGFRVVLLLRLTPLVPYNLLNYALGTTRVRLAVHALATALGMLPATLLNAYLGAGARDLASVLSAESLEGAAGTASARILLVVRIGAFLLLTVVTARMARRILRGEGLEPVEGAAGVSAEARPAGEPGRNPRPGGGIEPIRR